MTKGKSPDIAKVKIFNLSDHVLASEEISLLEKGLKFAPSLPLNKFSTFVDLNKFIRKLCLRKFFIDKTESGDADQRNDTPFRPKSFFYPSHVKGFGLPSSRGRYT